MKLLIDEYPLIVLPTLAAAIGLNEAIVLQQIHYWMPKSTFEHDGKTWIYNTAAQWQEQLPFWSESTIRRALNSLKKQGLIEVERLSPDRRDKTSYYTINYDKLAEKSEQNRVTDASSQNDQSHLVKMTDASSQNGHMFNKAETTTETTADIEPPNSLENKKPKRSKKSADRFEEFWQAYPNTPRRVAKKKCRDRWRSRGLDEIADQIIDHVRAMVPTRQWQEGYEPAPMTYINQNRWEDGVPQERPASRGGGSEQSDDYSSFHHEVAI